MKFAGRRLRRSPSPLDSPAFRRWFGDSKVVDESGEPLVVYHGTVSGGFDVFRSHARKGEQLGFGIHFADDEGFARGYADGSQARTPAKGAVPTVYAVFLSIQNPLDVERLVSDGTDEFRLAQKLAGKRLVTTKDDHGVRVAYLRNAIELASPERAQAAIKEAGYDGVRYIAQLVSSSAYGWVKGSSCASWIVFDPRQIKSATDNAGTFDPDDPSILRNSEASTALRRNGGQVLYHGSDADDLEELDGNDPGYTGSLGWGLYLTTQPEFAKIFGKHIYEVESPVPDELVAYIEPDLYDCGNSLTMYTPGSAPFTFEIEDRKTGETHRYSILGDCEEEVRGQLRGWALEKFKPSQELKDDVNKLPPALAARVGVGAKEILDAAIETRRTDDAIDAVIETMAEEGVDDDLLDNEVKPLLEAFERELDEAADAKIAERLGTEIDLDDISATVSEHGYSAFFISGYAPGDEYVIVDEKYLPIPVTK